MMVRDANFLPIIAERSEKYREASNNIKRCMKKAKDNWIGEQCSEIEENLRKHNSKRARETAGEILGKHRQKKKPGSLQKFSICVTKGEN